MKVLLCLMGLFAFAAAHSCPPLWTSGPKGCYRYFAKARTWEAARDHCSGFSSCVGNSIGNLVSIGSQAENDYVKLLRESSILATPAPSIWTAGNDRIREGNWQWANGQPWDPTTGYANWEQGQPNNQGGAENCLRFPGQRSVDQWDDFDCLTELPYICHLFAEPAAQPQPPVQPRFLYGQPQQSQIGYK
uniref:SM21 protein n=1 Tax=Ophiomastix wendtii TaxID=7623 RepID=A0A0K0M966_9ECHI|nr:SM21 protein [Ophiomastix wendtii]